MRHPTVKSSDPQFLSIDIQNVPPVARRYPRRAPLPVEIPEYFDQRPLRVAVVYSVCYRFRMPIFRRLSSQGGLVVRIFVGTGYPGTKLTNAKDMSGIDVRVLKTFSKRVKSSGRDVIFSFNPTLFWQLFRYRPDVIVVQGGELLNNLSTLIYARLFRKSIVWWSLGEVRGRRFSGLSKAYRNLAQRLERRSDAFAAYSSAGVDYFLRQGIDARKVFNLVNVVDTELVKRNIEKEKDNVSSLRLRLGLNGRLVILYVGAMTVGKGVDRLLQAFARIVPNYPDLRLVLVGEGPMRGEAQELADELNVASFVHFVGDVFEGVSAYFLLGDLVVAPGTGGLVVSDAMTHCRAVIAGIGDGVETDLIDHGSNGFLLTTDSIDELADTMEKAICDRDRIREMGWKARDRIDEFANIDAYMNELLGAIWFAYTERKGSK